MRTLTIALLLAAASVAAAADLDVHPAGEWGIDLTDRDPSIRPGDDFFLSQNGAWFRRTELGSQTVAAYWSDLRRLAPRRLGAILEEVAANKALSTNTIEGKAGAFYRAWMDETTVEAKGLTPLAPQLDAIRTAQTRPQIAALMGSAEGPETLPMLKQIGPVPSRGFFLINIHQDQHDPDRYAVYIGQGGLGLPGPEYYLDPQLADIRAAYQSYAVKMLTLIGWPDAERHAAEIVEIETRVAEVSWSHEQMRDVVKTYNRMTVAELSRFASGFDWRAFLAGAQVPDVGSVVIDAKSAFPKIAAIFAAAPIDTLKAREAFLLADAAAPNLYAAAVNASFDFHTRTFSNKSAVLRPRNVRGWSTMEMNAGDMLGALYVARYFSPESKSAALEITSNLKRAFDARLARLSWMRPASRTIAREKLAKMKVNLGYPDHFPDYSGVEIRDDDLYGDVARVTRFRWLRQVHRLNAPFDRSEWTFTPQSVNYSYSPTSNTVEIPAATLQPPFFDLHADAAVNYGAIGTLIGATIASAFDHQGIHFDAAGRLRDWLSPAESAKLDAMWKAVADQYSAVEPLPGLHVKGELVANEAVDDIGGVIAALDAYHLSLGGKPAPVLGGFTGDQRVFLGRAQMWRAKFDPTFVRNQLAIGNNAQPFLRVNGPVRNIDAWYEAFDVKPGDRMYLPLDARVHIW